MQQDRSFETWSGIDTIGQAKKQRRTPQQSKKHATTEEEELTSSDEEKAPAPTPAASKEIPKKIVFEDSKPPPPAAKPINDNMALQCVSDLVAKAAGVDLVGEWWFCLIWLVRNRKQTHPFVVVSSR